MKISKKGQTLTIIINTRKFMRYYLIPFCTVLALIFVLLWTSSRGTGIPDSGTRDYYEGLRMAEAAHDMKVSKVQDDFEDFMDNCIKGQDIDTEDIAVGYYNFDTGIHYSLNTGRQMTAASTYKLPLCMYVYDLLHSGRLSSSSALTFSQSCLYDSEGGIVSYGYWIGDKVPVLTLLKTTITQSDNNAAHILMNYLGGYKAYVEKIQKYTDESPDLADYSRSRNNIRTAYMMDVLSYLYHHQDDYSTLICDMKEAAKNEYLQKYVSVPVAHKYGNLGQTENDVGIVFCDSPYAIAVYTHGVDNAPDKIGRINKAVLEFTDKYIEPLTN
jgi:Beta-lactamase class A